MTHKQDLALEEEEHDLKELSAKVKRQSCQNTAVPRHNNWTCNNTIVSKTELLQGLCPNSTCSSCIITHSRILETGHLRWLNTVSSTYIWIRVWKGIFRIRHLTKIRYGNILMNILTGPGIWLFPGKPDSPKLGTGCRIYVCVSVGNAGNHHDPPVPAAKANKPGEH